MEGANKRIKKVRMDQSNVTCVNQVHASKFISLTGLLQT